MVADDTGLITRFCRDCTRHLGPDPHFEQAVYHRWRFINGEWLRLVDVIQRTPKG